MKARRMLPNASFIGFTGTPIELTDRNNRAVCGDETLRAIARGLVGTVRATVTIDWTIGENVGAQLRMLVKRFRPKYGYPTGKQEKTTQTVLEQAAVLSEAWAAT